jgi:hypothetical protein
VLAVKGNQPQLHAAVADYFETPRANDFAAVPVSTYEAVDAGHGRSEVRRCWLVTDLRTLTESQRWRGLRGIALVEAERHHRGQVSCEQRYHISRRRPNNQRVTSASSLGLVPRPNLQRELTQHLIGNLDSAAPRIGYEPWVMATASHGLKPSHYTQLYELIIKYCLQILFLGVMGWADEEFRDIDLGDKRRDSRAIRLAERFAERPTASIPGASSGWAETQAAYRFLAGDPKSGSWRARITS